MKEPGYEFFDHTADSGVEIVAPTREAALSASARAFLHVLTDAPETVEEREELPVEVRGIDPEAALVALGNELLYLFEVEHFLCARFEPARVTETEISGTAFGERFDPERHPIARTVKAVTHHGATFEEVGGEVRARLIFDL